MAFALSQTWNAAGLSSGGAETSAQQWRLFSGQERYFRRLGAIVFSILVHMLLLWLLLSRLAGGAVGVDGAAAHRGVLSFSLNGPASAASAPRSESREILPPQVQQGRVSEVDASMSASLPPQEWTVSRLPPAASPPSAAASGSALAGASAGPGNPGAGSGGGRKDVYDPYAGAAPLRREDPGSGTAGSLGTRVLGFFGFGERGETGLSLDRAALDAIRFNVERSLPGRKGTAEILVRVSPTGMVLEADARGGSAPPEVLLALRRALIGKRLFSGTAANAQTLTLPVLSLG